ncbi:LysM peptidoglycan-binding domain-containing protein [Halomonas getboli]|uniref:LysM peptidoglycan-binding domain-containing protein n=1 Tax=Halomonas getboli TaxID=2935862 RepID=UPI001FFFF95E|nr:LysM domain-containing protein [Halomonas getboli]MCK2184373.1 LysM peptidoglycan-binding domain-containing protein [Halomonas getboli]
MDYVIKDGDTLSELAETWEVSVEKLLELNPEIQDPDMILRDGTLTLPGTGARRKTGDWIAKASSASSSPLEFTVLQLPFFDPPPAAGGEVQEAAPPPCEDDAWADILYLTGTGTFWLLTESVAESLHEAADELAGWVAVEDPEARQVHLNDDAGLMECFLPARPENFLNEGERQQCRNMLSRLAELSGEAEGDAARRVAEHEGLTETDWFWVSPLIVSISYYHERAQHPEETQLLDELNALYRKGSERAQAQGYVIDGSRYYGPWEDDIAEALETYRLCRARVVGDAISVTQPGELLPLQEALKEYQDFLADCESMSPKDSSRCTALVDYFSERVELMNEDIKAYRDSIVALATLGIATPEWALADPALKTSRADLDPGIDAFNHYNRLLKEAVDIYDDVEARLEEWTTATAGNAALPMHLFAEERRRFERRTSQLDALYATARQAVAAMQPQRVLFWQADLEDQRHALGYEKQSIDVLVRKDFPLREFSSPQGARALSHLSLHQLQRDMSEDERQQLSRQLEADGALPATLWEAPETALSQWLEGQGCEKIERRAEWFDEGLGFFRPETFFQYLDDQAYEVASLRDDGARSQWGEALQRMLFTGPARETLRLFDASAQAQMLRLVGMPHGELNQALSHEFDESLTLLERDASLELFDVKVESSGGGQLGAEQKRQGTLERQDGGWEAGQDHGAGVKAGFQWEVKGTWSLARGEISLGTLHLPGEDEAVPFDAVLANRDGERRSMGCYSIRMELVAKGFAGASVALGAETGLAFNENGLQLTGVDWAQREAEGATLKAFAGATLGLQTQCELRWQPPEDITRQLPQLADQDWLSLKTQQRDLDQWRGLGQALLGGEVGVGIGAELGFRLGLRNGRFVAYAKAKVFAGVTVGGKIAVELDLEQLDLWLMMIGQALRDNDYGFVDWVDEDAFDSISQLTYLATTTLLDVGLLAARGRDGIRRLYNQLTQSDRAGVIAFAIVDTSGNSELSSQMSAWVQHLTPEALGPLLNVLATRPSLWSYMKGDEYDDAIDLQQIAIAQCLEWIEQGHRDGVYRRSAAQRLFEKAVARMSADGDYAGAEDSENERDNKAARGQAYCENRYRLDQFMEEKGSVLPEVLRARNKYIDIANRLGRDADVQCQRVTTPGGTHVTYRES